MTRTAIDWEQVRARLRASEQALDEALSESPARIEAAYRKRAIRLATVPAASKPVSAGRPAIVFRLAEERYAIELSEVSEVLAYARCTPAPESPPEVLGVINLRGELRAVLDLGRLLGLSSERDGDGGFVLFLRRPGQELGVRVDRIEQLIEIRPEELAPPSRQKYLKGLVSGTLMLLNVDAVLAQLFSPQEES